MDTSEEKSDKRQESDRGKLLTPSLFQFVSIVNWIDFHQNDIWFGPVLVNSNHWVLWVALLSQSGGQFLLFDSLSTGSDDEVKHGAERIIQLNTHHSGQLVHISSITSPQQSDEINCGVFACMNILHLVMDQASVAILFSNMDRCRKHIAASIAAGKIIGLEIVKQKSKNK